MAASEIIFAPGMRLPRSLYLDTTIVVAFLDRNHGRYRIAAQFLVEALAAKVQICISPLVLDELWYILMQCWNKAEHGTKFDSANRAHIERYAPRIRTRSQELLDLLTPTIVPVTPLPALFAWAYQRPFSANTENIVQTALGILTMDHLGPRDSFHLSTATEAGVDALATLDRGFVPTNHPKVNLTILRVA